MAVPLLPEAEPPSASDTSEAHPLHFVCPRVILPRPIPLILCLVYVPVSLSVSVSVRVSV